MIKNYFENGEVNVVSSSRLSEEFKKRGQVLLSYTGPIDVMKVKELEEINGKLQPVGYYVFYVSKTFAKQIKNHPENRISYRLLSTSMDVISEEEYEDDEFITDIKRAYLHID
jgi:hypothetical protein